MQFIHDANLPPNTPPSPLPLCLSAIMSISHPPSASQKSCPSAIIPKSHYANQPPCPPPSANMPITHHLPLKNYAHQPSYLKAIMPISHHAPPPLQPIKQISHHDPPSPLPHHIHWPSCQSATVPLPPLSLF